MGGYFAEHNPSRVNPLIIGIICGYYPLVFYFSNNFWAVNSWQHLGYFLLIFIGIPVFLFSTVVLFFKTFPELYRYRLKTVFVLIVMTVGVLMSWAMFLDMKKKILLGLLIVSSLLAIRLYRHYRKLLALVLLMSILPTLTCAVKCIEQIQSPEWTKLPDQAHQPIFINKPNIYVIQPDGYVGREMMKSEPYLFENPFYEWLESEEFTVYDCFRSNYPASLTSNASMFAMRQHHYGRVLSPGIEMPHAREILAGNNNTIQILKRNGYSNFFIVQDDYFQQNFPEQHYDYYNIDQEKIPFFSDGKNLEADVLKDLKKAMDTAIFSGPRFYFVEKLLPHHIHFSASKEEERNSYIKKIQEVNEWLKTTIGYISKEDPDAIIIILADHGGWVGIGSYPEMFATRDPGQVKSIFSTLAAVKWNGHLRPDFDKDMRSNVNLFRVLFSVLSNNQDYLKYTEDNSSYLLEEGAFFRSVRMAIDEEGKVLTQ